MIRGHSGSVQRGQSRNTVSQVERICRQTGCGLGETEVNSFGLRTGEWSCLSLNQKGTRKSRCGLAGQGSLALGTGSP